MALANIGQASINSLEDENERARKCKLFYDVALNETLRSHDWKFARGLYPLAEIKECRLPDWTYVYKYPQNAVNVIRLVHFGKKVSFTVSSHKDYGRIICCHVKNALAECTKKETNTDLYDASFIRVMAWTLASDLAISLTGDQNTMAMAQQQRELELDKARYNDREEGDTFITYESSYLPTGNSRRK